MGRRRATEFPANGLSPLAVERQSRFMRWGVRVGVSGDAVNTFL